MDLILISRLIIFHFKYICPHKIHIWGLCTFCLSVYPHLNVPKHPQFVQHSLSQLDEAPKRPQNTPNYSCNITTHNWKRRIFSASSLFFLSQCQNTKRATDQIFLIVATPNKIKKLKNNYFFHLKASNNTWIWQIQHCIPAFRISSKHMTWLVDLGSHKSVLS